MAGIITKQLAEAIVRTLGAAKHSKKNRPHDLYTLSYRGQVIVRFGVRRGSAKDQGHNHIPGQIHLSPHDARAFGECGRTLEWYIQELIAKGIIEEE